ncbi:MAG: hypothetical protein QOF76_4505 [Solirubrobacteraceae bacterium]|jgi:hypothetical protein|nr:hypothetical protein [Solirubrobacteraceae bacterium]
MTLVGDWELWPELAVRSAGFPVAGLDAFGPGDEAGRLAAAARDGRFLEAVTWQNPAAARNAVRPVADGTAGHGSKAVRRETVVASYWQRYCAKNDTIGFFGPLAWGSVDGPAFSFRGGAVECERSVHLEAWAVQALAAAIDPDLCVPTGPRAEDDLREMLDEHGDAAVRAGGLAALERLERARDRVAVAPAEDLLDALAGLDAVFVELTGREPVRHSGRAYGARTLTYLDSMRDVDLTLGQPVLDELAPALGVLFEASRWFCGEVHAVAREIVARALPQAGPFGPVLGRVLGELMSLPPAVHDAVAELQARVSALVADPDPQTIGARAEAAFADHRPAWPRAVHHSVDIQLAARDADAIAAGDYLAVVGDIHPGDNPLGQGLFADRHPNPEDLLNRMAADVGPGVPELLPPLGPGLGVDARGVAPTHDDTTYISVLPETRARGGRRTWWAGELEVDGEDVVDRSGTLRANVLDVLGLPIFITAVRTFALLPEAEHAPRVTIGRVVLRRESWRVPAADIPQRFEDVPAFARDRGMPRRVFTSSPLERKPMYLDVESPRLARILCRQARAAEGGDMRFTEMLPGPSDCWLADAQDNRYVSELRLVAADSSSIYLRARRSAAAPAASSFCCSPASPSPGSMRTRESVNGSR